MKQVRIQEEDTLNILELMEQERKPWGMVFDCEK